MKAKIRVLLLFPSLAERNSSPPLGLGYIASILEREDCEVRIIDAAPLSAHVGEERILKDAWEFQPHIIGIHLLIVNITSAYRLAKMFGNGRSLLVAGGPHASVLPHEPLQNGFDVSVRGEGEFAMVDLARHVKGELPLSRIAGISYNSAAGVIDNPGRELIRDLDSLPRPAFHLFRPNHYKTSSKLYQFAGSLVATRGCPYQCFFCFKGVFGDGVRTRSAGNLVDEIQYVHDRYGVTFVNFIDEFFTVNRRRIEEFCELLLERGLGIEWMANSRVDAVSPDLLTMMKRAGCYMLHYGVESVDVHSLERLRKRIDEDEIISALRWTKEAGIRTQVYLMCGFPWETPQSVERNIRFLRDNRLLIDEVLNRTFLVPFPGTDAYEKYHEKHGFTDWWKKKWYIESFSLGDYIPLHNRVFFHDYRLCQRPLFDYSGRTRWKIKKLITMIGRRHLALILPNIYRSALKRNAYLLILSVSRVCHMVDLRFGRFVMNTLFQLVSLISPGKAQYLR